MGPAEEANAPDLLKTVPPGQDVNTEGEGDILRIVATPQDGRALDSDGRGLISR